MAYHLTMLPSLSSKHSSPAHSMPQPGTGSRVARNWEKTKSQDSKKTHRSLEHSRGKTVVASVCAYLSSAPEAAQTSDGTTAAGTPTTA